MRGLQNQRQTVSQIARPALRGRDEVIACNLALPPDDSYDNSGNNQHHGHHQQKAFGAKAASDPNGKETREDAACNAATAEHAKPALGLTCRPNEVGEGPYLGWRQDTERTDPDVEDDVEPWPLIKMNGPPKHQQVRGIETEA